MTKNGFRNHSPCIPLWSIFLNDFVVNPLPTLPSTTSEVFTMKMNEWGQTAAICFAVERGVWHNQGRIWRGGGAKVKEGTPYHHMGMPCWNSPKRGCSLAGPRFPYVSPKKEIFFCVKVYFIFFIGFCGMAEIASYYDGGLLWEEGIVIYI